MQSIDLAETTRLLSDTSVRKPRCTRTWYWKYAWRPAWISPVQTICFCAALKTALGRVELSDPGTKSA